MKRALLRLALLGVLAGSLMAVAPAQSSGSVSLPKYHYALRRVTPEGGNYSYINWNGTLNFNEKVTRDELLVERDGKIYRITDKATLDAFEKYFEPIKAINDEKAKFMEEYGQAKGNAKAYDRQARSIERRIRSTEDRLERARSEDERKEVREELDGLNRDLKDASRQAEEARRRFEPLQRKREEMSERKEKLRQTIYPKTDRLIEEAIAKGLAERTN